MLPLISHDYLRVMARYNRWQNAVMFEAASGLSDEVRRTGAGAFWSTIHGTCSHLYWADRMWLSRFDVADKPDVPLGESARFVEDWADLLEKRVALDDVLVNWCDGFPSGPVGGSVTWFSGAAGRDVTAPLSVILAHVFNHQTHHRGQVHAMLTAAGAKTADTDLFLMPREMWPPAP